MNFFEHQELARRQTRRLIVLFVLAVISIVLAVNLAGTVIWRFSFGAAYLPAYFYPTNTLLVLGLILGGSLVETLRLRAGGDEVARMVGARLLVRNSEDAFERRLLNIVEEMSIASGVAMPRVYVMDRELSINAFAAGFSPNEAVVAVSGGALRRLSRDELQGVVAHEFSHLLNGDMRLNLHLIGLVYGLLLVALLGEQMMSSLRYSGRAVSRREGVGIAAGLFVAGVALWIIGYIGVFFGRLIKAAVSRQREYLADASAVQFTRNADGIGGALRKIGGLGRELGLGSRIDHPQAEALSHLFFGAARPAFVNGLLATHPPIDERIRRIYGRAMPLIEAPLPEPSLNPAPPEQPLIEFETVASFDAARAAYDAGFAQARAVIAPDAVIGTVGRPEAAETRFAHALGKDVARRTLIDAVREPVGAQATVLALLLDENDQVALTQRAAVGDNLLGAMIDSLAPHASRLNKTLSLPLVDLAIPTFKQLDADERERFLALVEKFIRIDGRVSLAEFVLQTLLTRRLALQAGRAVRIKYREIAQLPGDVALVASLIANACANGAGVRTAQQRMQAASAQVASSLPLLPAEAIRKYGVDGSLDRLNQLAPLRKPLVIKAFVAAAVDNEGALTLAGADLLRAVCAALDAPMPPVVEAVYLRAA